MTGGKCQIVDDWYQSRVEIQIRSMQLFPLAIEENESGKPVGGRY